MTFLIIFPSHLAQKYYFYQQFEPHLRVQDSKAMQHAVQRNIMKSTLLLLSTQLQNGTTMVRRVRPSGMMNQAYGIELLGLIL